MVARSTITKLLLLALIFCIVPFILYDQFREAYRANRQLLFHSAQAQGRLIVRALAPLLESGAAKGMPEPSVLNETLQRLTEGGMRIRLLFQPTTSEPGSFYYVAAAPPAEPSFLADERNELSRQGVLDRLAPSCAGDIDSAIRYRTAAGSDEVLTSITPYNATSGCWIIVTSHRNAAYQLSALGRPYWDTPEIRTAAVIYGAAAIAVLGLFVGVWRSLRRFGRLAREIRASGGTAPRFAAQNRIPELSGVAEEFDRMVDALQQSARGIRRAAEDNAHAFKTPIAVIRQCLDPLQRSVPETDHRAQRALGMIGSALDRLDGLVAFSRHMDETEASLINPPQMRIDISECLDRLLDSYAEFARGHRVTLARQVEARLNVTAGEELVETVIENILDNALSFTPPGGTLSVRLQRHGKMARLAVEDDGPGVPPADLDRIFERYFSGRHRGAASDGDVHMGIGLWIVRRNVEAIGGRVTAENLPDGGLAMRVELPLA